MSNSRLLTSRVQSRTFNQVMRRFLPIFAAAAFGLLASDAPVTADQVVTDTVDIMDVDENDDVVGLPDGTPPPRWYVRSIQGTIHAKGPLVPPDPVVPPDPCHAFIQQWNNNVDNTSQPPQVRFARFTRLLTKFEQFSCRVEIDRPVDDSPEVPAIEIRPILE